MPTTVEEVCCRSYKKIRQLMPTDEAVLCVTDLDAFSDNCLNPHVLETSRYEYMECQGPFGDEKPLNEYTFEKKIYKKHLFAYLSE